MNRLWAPWRNTYLTKKRQKGCIFCLSLKSKSKNYIVFRNRCSFCIINIFPYNNGHVMVTPNRHVKDLAKLKEIEILDLFKSVNEAKKILDMSLKPEGYNIGINLTRSAGAGVPGHTHIHIVPRWTGDTNFMPVIAGTKIISQSLDELEKILKSNYAKSKRNQKIRR